MNEVHAPDVIGILRPEPDDGTVFVIEPFTPLVTMGQLQTFFPPKAFHLLVIHSPAFDTQHLGNLAIPISAILLGQSDQSQAQVFIIGL